MHVATIAEMMIAVIFGFEFMILAGLSTYFIFSNIFASREIFRCRGAIVEARNIECKHKIKYFSWHPFLRSFGIFSDAHRIGA